MVMMINLNTTTSEIKPENQFNSLNLIKKYLFRCYVHHNFGKHFPAQLQMPVNRLAISTRKSHKGLQ